MKRFIFIICLLLFSKLLYSQYKTGAGDGFFVFSGLIEFTLPVKIIDFSVKQNGDKILINWITGSEINNSHFYIEKSKNGILWETLAIIDGVGNSEIAEKYSYQDNDVNCNSNLFYKLHQVDFDGTDNVIGVKKIEKKEKCEEKYYFTVNPNSIVNVAQINLNNITTDFCELKVYNLNGKTIHNLKVPIGTKSFSINCSSFMTSGVYFFSIQKQDSIAYHQIVTKI